MLRRWSLVVFSIITACLVVDDAVAQLQTRDQRLTNQLSRSALSSRANAGVVGIISGGADGTYIRIAADLANVLDDGQLRILPVIGRGSLQNLRDIMFLRGIDIGIVQMDARPGLRADNLEQESAKRLRYIARLYNEEVHVLASKAITDVRQLVPLHSGFDSLPLT